MYESIPFDILVYYMLYGGAAIMAAVACLHLLMWRINPFVDNVTPPKRLRRWTAAFMAVVLGSHLWWLPDSLGVIKIYSGLHIISSILDCALLVPVMLSMPLTMLQDRRRPLWPLFVAVIPLVIALVVCLFKYDYTVMVFVRFYLFALLTAYFFYMLFALRQYRRWLIDNYADLEHKEVWLSLVVIVILLVMLGIYSVSNNGIFIQTFIQFSEIFILAFIFWRVETLQTLHAPQADTETVELSDDASNGDTKDGAEAGAAVTLPTNISQLLKQYCEDTRLYLQHDITRDDLSKAVGTNRSYLSLYFAQQGETYNSYINKLRIQHFVNDYREAIATKRPFTAQQLAHESGFGSYATFGRAFKQTMGQTVTEWMKDEA
jgi:AraC-like DNA-binding protein